MSCLLYLLAYLKEFWFNSDSFYNFVSLLQLKCYYCYKVCARLQFTFRMEGRRESCGQLADSRFTWKVDIKLICMCLSFDVHCPLTFVVLPSVLQHGWLGVRKSIQPVKIEWSGAGVLHVSLGL